MKVIFITGSYPPDICGVGDYTYKLVSNFKKGIDIQVEKFDNCTLLKFMYLIKKLVLLKPNIIHIQYPTEGYGYSIYPQLLSLFFFNKLFVTIHEFSSKSIIGKLSIYLYFIFSKKVIFTTEQEFKYCSKLAPFLINKAIIINIGSNIPLIESNSNKEWDVVYFGHIRPMKGIEDFLKLAEHSKLSGKNFRYLLIGQNLKRYQEYFEMVKDKCIKFNVEIKISLQEYDVAINLSKSKFAYLTFPDGLTLRRGSFLAAFGNRCRIISNRSQNSEAILNNIVLWSTSYMDAYNIIISNKGIEFNDILYNKILNSLRWENIAIEHLNQYQNILK